MSDEPSQSYGTFSHLLALCLVFNSLSKTPTSSQSKKYTIFFFPGPHPSILSLGLPPIGQVLFQITYKNLSRELYKTYILLIYDQRSAFSL